MSSDVATQPKKYERSTAGLRDALFGEMEDLASGTSAPHEALAFSKLAAQIISSVELDLRHAEIEVRAQERELRHRELALQERELLDCDMPIGDGSTQPDDSGLRMLLEVQS